jgi:hypothetical protein
MEAMTQPTKTPSKVPRSVIDEQPRWRPRAPLARLLAGGLVSLLLLAAGTAAQAEGASPIEAVWSFNGGEVAIQPQPDGSFVGTVVETTKFAQCSHAVGEHMWTGMHQQSDGSFWGFHQWYFESSACRPNPTPGPTAWRVLKAANGSRTLIVCFSSPGSGQPSITSTDMRLDVSYGCFESALVGPLPAEANALAFRRSVSLPSTRKCFSARIFPIHLKDPRHDPLKSVVVKLGSRKITVLRQGRTFTATVNLKGLPRGTFTVRIVATTVLGQRLSGSRTYHTCRNKRLKHGPPKPLRRPLRGRRH